MTKLKTIPRYLPHLYIIAGGIAFLASLLLSIDKIKLLENPAVDLPCNFSPFISCGSVMETAQSAVFGFPNSFIGVGVFAAITAIGFALLAGGTFKNWFWHGMQMVLTFSMLFVLWLAYESIFTIGSLCPYCMVVWTMTIPLFAYTTAYNFPRLKTPGILASLLYSIIIGAIIYQFWIYWISIF